MNESCLQMYQEHISKMTPKLSALNNPDLIKISDEKVNEQIVKRNFNGDDVHFRPDIIMARPGETDQDVRENIENAIEAVFAGRDCYNKGYKKNEVSESKTEII